jgi:ankyrin repeat protein
MGWSAGASPRQSSEGGATPLHAAARVGPLALVELLIIGGALSWQGDQRGKSASSGVASRPSSVPKAR